MSNSNSPLVCYTKISPNKNPQPSKSIKYVAVHCVVGQCLIESLGALFALPSKQASSNYGVDKDGRIGMFVEEKDRSWCTSTSLDANAITIEVASDMSPPFAVRNEAYVALLDLLEDICRRNGKKKMLWFGDKQKTLAYEPKADEIVMIVHMWFANKACPGEYLLSRHSAIAKEITKRLGYVPEPTPTPTPQPQPSSAIKVGDCVKIKQGAVYSNGRPIPSIILAETWIVESVKDNLVLINKSVKNGWAINSWVDEKYLTIVGKNFEPYIVRVEVDALNIRLAPSTLATVVGTIKDNGAYTIVAEEDGVGATRWGKLKSGAGWISLDYCKFVRKV